MDAFEHIASQVFQDEGYWTNPPGDYPKDYPKDYPENPINHAKTYERYKTPNLYQLYAYVMNKQIERPRMKRSGMLLYPEVHQSFTDHFTLQGHPMTIASINLNQPWQDIHQDLLEIASPTSATSKMDAFRVSEIIDSCALRFDGYGYMDVAHQENLLSPDVDFLTLNGQSRSLTKRPCAK